MITKESLLFHGIESSSRSGDLLPVTRRNALLKAAFLLGNRGEKREIIAAIRGVAEIPPAVKWDAETITSASYLAKGAVDKGRLSIVSS